MGKLRVKKSTRVHLKAAPFDSANSSQPDQVFKNRTWDVLKPASFVGKNLVSKKQDLQEDNWTIAKNNRSKLSKSIKSNKKTGKDSKSTSFYSQNAKVSFYCCIQFFTLTL